MNVAKLSLSQRSFHHFIVTRSPNHWCAISCAITDATLFFVIPLVFSFTRIAVSLKVIAPQFSIAPAPNSGTEIRCIFGREG